MNVVTMKLIFHVVYGVSQTDSNTLNPFRIYRLHAELSCANALSKIKNIVF